MANDRSLGQPSSAGPAHDFTFTGWESDAFARFAQYLAANGYRPRVRVIGREPITNIRVDLYGDVIDALWNGYRRSLTIESGGVIYDVGGTNATCELAAHAVVFQSVPERFTGSVAYTDNLDSYLAGLASGGPFSKEAVQAIWNGLRLGGFSPDQKRAIATTVTAALGSANEELRVQLTCTIGMVEIKDILHVMITLLQDRWPTVRREAALRFRALEPLIKEIGQDSAEGALCIGAVAAALDDDFLDVRIYAAEDLGYFYNTHAVDKLTELLEQDQSPDVRWAATIAIGRTNHVNIPSLLYRRLCNDPSSDVQKGAALSLSRWGSKIANSDSDMAALVAEKMAELGGDPACTIRDNCLYALGELGSAGVVHLQTLVEALAAPSFEIKACSALSLQKLYDLYYMRDDEVDAIQAQLISNLGASMPSGWPGLAYRQWYLAAAGELAALIEVHDLSATYYSKAQEAFTSPAWHAEYYLGLSMYEKAEHVCPSDLRQALSFLDTATEAFARVAEDPAFIDESDTEQSGLQFKRILTQARFHMFTAVAHWRLHGLSSSIASVAEEFARASATYRRIDIFGFAADAKELTRTEQELVLTLISVAELGTELINLRMAAFDLDEKRIRLGLGNVRGAIRSLGPMTMKLRSRSLMAWSRQANDIVAASYLDERNGWSVTEVVTELMYKMQTLYQASMPTPATCPIVDFGSATMLVQLPASLAGDGSEDAPYLYPSNERLQFQVTVTVNRRTKHDRLIFYCEEPPSGAVNTTQEIQVHESLYSLRPIDFGRLETSPVASPHTFLLEFRNKGCSQVVDTKVVWVRIFDQTKEFQSEQERKQARITALTVSIEQARTRLEHYRSVGRGLRSEPLPIELRERIRQLEIEIDLKSDELYRLRRDNRSTG